MVRRARLLLAFLTLAGLMVGAIVPPAVLAQETLKPVFFIFDLTSIATNPGQEVKLSSRVKNRGDNPIDVKLEILGQPRDWDVAFWANFPSLKIKSLRVSPQDFVPIELRINVPANAEVRDYSVLVGLQDTAGKEIDRVPVTITVEQQVKTGKDLDVTAQYASISGPSGSTFSYSVQLVNNTSQQRTFDLSANVPRGWTFSFKPAFENKLVSSIGVGANSSQRIDVEVRPPPYVEPGKYPILVGAVGGQLEASVELTAELTGTHTVALGTVDGRLDAKATAGRPNPVTLVVANQGTAILDNIQLISRPPQGWQVTLDPSQIQRLEVNEALQVTANITPAEKAIPGDYMVSLLARSDFAQQQIELRVTVTQSTVWGWLGVLVVIVVILGMMGLFFRLGRR